MFQGTLHGLCLHCRTGHVHLWWGLACTRVGLQAVKDAMKVLSTFRTIFCALCTEYSGGLRCPLARGREVWGAGIPLWCPHLQRGCRAACRARAWLGQEAGAHLGPQRESLGVWGERDAPYPTAPLAGRERCAGHISQAPPRSSSRLDRSMAPAAEGEHGGPWGPSPTRPTAGSGREVPAGTPQPPTAAACPRGAEGRAGGPAPGPANTLSLIHI